MNLFGHSKLPTYQNLYYKCKASRFDSVNLNFVYRESLSLFLRRVQNGFGRFINENHGHRSQIAHRLWMFLRKINIRCRQAHRCAWHWETTILLHCDGGNLSCCNCKPQKIMNKFATIYACVNLISSPISRFKAAFFPPSLSSSFGWLFWSFPWAAMASTASMLVAAPQVCLGALCCCWCVILMWLWMCFVTVSSHRLTRCGPM